MTSRGIRLNNPGNIRLGVAWQGMADVQNDKDFITFKSSEYGIRAMARVLMTYANKYSIDTVRGVIKRYAPPNENDTESYIDDVSTRSGINADEIIDLTDATVLNELIPAIIHHEEGLNPYTDTQIAEGIKLAIG